MRNVVFGLIASLMILSVPAAELQWTTDMPAAVQKAKADNRLVLLNFTGSDWCGWCIKLDKEVFSTSEFARYAEKNLVAVKIDFPRKKKLAPEQQKANAALREQFKVEGYPTIVVLNAQGKKVGELGYQAGGPAPFIEALKKLRTAKPS